MKLSKETVEILKNFATINGHIAIHPGNKISTMSASKATLATYIGADEFENEFRTANLNNFLSAYNALGDPELILDEKFVTMKSGGQMVKYFYAPEEVLILPPKKSLKMPEPEVKLEISNETISRLVKMAAVLSVDDLAIIGDGEKIIAKVCNKANPTANTFNLDLNAETEHTFTFYYKIEKLRLFPSDYDVEITSQKISRWTAKEINLVVFIALEKDSTFG